MFNNDFRKRLLQWRNLRNDVETSETPFELLIDFFSPIPQEIFTADPYDIDLWPEPWELLHENVYCRFTKLLAICYTLQLSERFSNSHFEIHIGIDEEKNDLVYTLYVDKKSISSYNDNWVINSKKEVQVQSKFNLPQRH